MKLSEWNKTTTPQRKMLILKHGAGLNKRDLLASMPYITAVINHVIFVKHSERLPRYSVKAAAEYLRWRTVAEDNSVLFKVNNNLTADLNHLLIAMFPELKGFFRVRKNVGVGG